MPSNDINFIFGTSLCLFCNRYHDYGPTCEPRTLKNNYIREERRKQITKIREELERLKPLLECFDVDIELVNPNSIWPKLEINSRIRHLKIKPFEE